MLPNTEHGKNQTAAKLETALREWRAAESYFQNVSDPDLIEYAVFDLEAARRKYVYMLKKARMDGINAADLKAIDII